MNILDFIRTKKLTIGYSALVTATVNFLLFTSSNLEKSLSDILYINFIITVLAITFGTVAFIGWRSRYKPLVNSLKTDQNIDSLIPDEKKFYFELLKSVVEKKNSEANAIVEERKKSSDELNDYITKWVHEIKMPVSVCELVLERMDDRNIAGEFQTELERIKFLANQVLYISRASSYEEDLAVREINLDRLVRSAIKRNSALLISKNIQVEVSDLNCTVLSDEKWISYVMDQLLNNSYKYTKQYGSIEISASMDDQRNVMLRFKDDGIGILKKDISRIFDKSFTGNNRSNLTKSTGMGLYISKKMLDLLGHRIEVSSEPGLFTEFTITFFRISDCRINIV